MNEMVNDTFSNVDYLKDLNFSVSLMNESLRFDTELDILFRPEGVLIALYVPIILLSLIANILLIVVAIKCNYTKK